jgi:transcriptional regulator with XRE-family HTH domain
MALFFDSQWFDQRLSAAGLSRSDVATALGLSPSQVEDLWKDQRELRAQDVRIIAALLGAVPAEVAGRAGVSTPVPKEEGAVLASLAARVERIEATLLEIRQLLLAMRNPK